MLFDLCLRDKIKAIRLTSQSLRIDGSSKPSFGAFLPFKIFSSRYGSFVEMTCYKYREEERALARVAFSPRHSIPNVN